MRVIRGSCALAEAPLALTIGNFDGVHVGHQAMLQRLEAAAGALGIASAVMLFEPQPQEFFAPDQAPARLTSLREKLALLARYGVDCVYVLRFDFRLAQLAAHSFVEDILCRRLRTRWLLVGDDFRFGARRSGDLDMLKRLSSSCGFDVQSMGSVVHEGIRVSSTAVRGCLERGDLDGARELLGRDYTITGRVVAGDSLGARLGYPTANVQLRRLRAPLAGIFVVDVFGLGPKPLSGVASLGVRPTVTTRGKPTLEVHLFDFDQRIYGQRIEVRFLQKLRDEEKYVDVDALVAQISRDVDAAREFFRRRDLLVASRTV